MNELAEPRAVDHSVEDISPLCSCFFLLNEEEKQLKEEKSNSDKSTVSFGLPINKL